MMPPIECVTKCMVSALHLLQTLMALFIMVLLRCWIVCFREGYPMLTTMYPCFSRSFSIGCMDAFVRASPCRRMTAFRFFSEVSAGLIMDEKPLCESVACWCNGPLFIKFIAGLFGCQAINLYLKNGCCCQPFLREIK